MGCTFEGVVADMMSHTQTERSLLPEARYSLRIIDQSRAWQTALCERSVYCGCASVLNGDDGCRARSNRNTLPVASVVAIRSET